MAADADAPQTPSETPFNTVEAVPRVASPSWRASISVLGNTGLPRDVECITPHFGSTAGGGDPQLLADALALNLKNWLTVAPQIDVNVYLEDGVVGHHPPIAHARQGTVGGTLTENAPREIALCLSYYAGFNRPRMRGRVYIPFTWIAKNSPADSSPGLVPNSGQIGSVQSFMVSVLRPAAVTAHTAMCIWSTVDKAYSTVTNYYTDNEWDTQRRRGLKSTSRQSAVY